jgi:hypothetical protein
MTTVNPVQSTTYYLSQSNNPIYFGGTDIVTNGGGAGVYGGSQFGSNSYNVTNAGKISGSSGIFLPTGGLSTVANLAGGIIAGDRYGVYIDIAGTVTNAGTISGGYRAVFGHDLTVINESGGSIGGAIGVFALDGGTVTNDSGGFIGDRFKGPGGYVYYGTPVFLTAGDGRNATVTNAGMIHGNSSGVIVEGSGALSVINESGGTINGGYNGSDPTFGVQGQVSGTVTNDSGGTIYGNTGVSLYAGSGESSTVTNAGTIIGHTFTGALTAVGYSVTFGGPFSSVRGPGRARVDPGDRLDSERRGGRQHGERSDQRARAGGDRNGEQRFRKLQHPDSGEQRKLGARRLADARRRLIGVRRGDDRLGSVARFRRTDHDCRDGERRGDAGVRGEHGARQRR